MICGNTLQVDDYSKYNWTIFDPDQKRAHHEKTFPFKLKHMNMDKACVTEPGQRQKIF